MHDHLAVFCAKQLVFIEALLGFVVISRVLPTRRHLIRRRWLVSMVSLCVLTAILALSGSLLYHDPRPFVSDGLKSLIFHEPNNGFPSDHALAAAMIVAAVGLLSPIYALPLAAVAFAVDWGRVACNVHHATDVLGSTAIVVVALMGSVTVARQVREISRD